MGVRRIMHMVAEPEFEADGMTLLYGPGEVHEIGALPPSVHYREIIMDDWEIAIAPEAAQ